MADRTEMLVGRIDLTTAKGLELGPLTHPVIRRDMGAIRYADHVDTDTLRARYRLHEGFDVDAIVPIDYAIGAGSLHDAVGADAPFDYVLGSHVIEHVPDLVRWLDDVRSVLRDDGILTLAIPDHRRCFDALRSPTVVADVVHAHVTRATVPTPRQVFDHYSSAVTWHGSIAWAEEPPIGELVSVHSEHEAIERATASDLSGEYDDVHCWVFTPRSFRRVVAAMQRLGLMSFRLESCSETIGGEFFVTMHATTRDDATASAAPFDSVEDLRAADAASVRAELADHRARLAAVQAELDATVTSRSWKITAPLRTFNQRRAARRRR
ncbi:MAG: hypothetical protein JWN99_3420 [Ilumatobacteraceae bacterium]|nr:hypothetical protein [Ilumatobacteraceae bacterium]